MVDRSSGRVATSPIHQRHVEAGARFAEFGGWLMPLEYAGSVKEHLAVRTGVGIFDVSHLGKLLVRGDGAARYVDSCLTNDLGSRISGQAQYTLCCNEAGGVVDDVICYLRHEDEVFLIPNAANAAVVASLLRSEAPSGVEVVNRHPDYAIIAVQGPDCDRVLAEVGLPTGHPYMSFVDADRSGDAPGVVVCRTGYTGERGYEIVVPAGDAITLWDDLVRAGTPLGLVPAGLAARDTLRTEMGYPLHGQDLSAQVTPVQARLGWAVGWAKPAFWGRAALLAERAAGPARLLRGIVAARRAIPRPGMAVFGDEADPDLAGARVGEITSGTFSPTRRQGIGLALLDARIRDGHSVIVDVRGRREAFVVTKPPFVTPGVRAPASASGPASGERPATEERPGAHGGPGPAKGPRS